MWGKHFKYFLKFKKYVGQASLVLLYERCQLFLGSMLLQLSFKRQIKSMKYVNFNFNKYIFLQNSIK